MRNISKTSTLLIMILLLAPGISSAHGFGQSLIKTVGDYAIDIDYDVIGDIQAGQSLRFDYRLTLNDTGQYVTSSSIFVNIEKATGESIFATTLGPDPDFGTLAMGYIFPVSGGYSLSARYVKDGKVIAEGKFPLNVLAADYEAKNDLRAYVNYAASAVIGAFVAYAIHKLISKRRRRF